MNEHIKEIKEHKLLRCDLISMCISNLICVNHHAEEKDDLAEKDSDHDDLNCVKSSTENFGYSITVEDIVGSTFCYYMCWSSWSDC